MSAAIEVGTDNEGVHISQTTSETVSRKTKDGRILTYTLKVIQQPDHARACGSGQKAHADRRPVDPPPVVELTIRDEKGADVTLSYDANFFLFATLELAGSTSAGIVPVLTGVNVSGMAYLDRPTPAGYFLFPDLSVRHEGNYKLTFSLYEEIKHANDDDNEPRIFAGPHPIAYDEINQVIGPLAAKQHMYYRLEVKSTEFTVYSAKKFPGLENSTALSRTIAEQGCRIRIRRDVRMRRREHKSKKGEEADGKKDADSSRRSSTAGPQSIASTTTSTLTTPVTAEYPKNILMPPSVEPINTAPRMLRPSTTYPSEMYTVPSHPYAAANPHPAPRRPAVDMSRRAGPPPVMPSYGSYDGDESNLMEVDPHYNGTSIMPDLGAIRRAGDRYRDYSHMRHHAPIHRASRTHRDEGHLPDAPAVAPAMKSAKEMFAPPSHRPAPVHAPQTLTHGAKRTHDQSFGAESLLDRSALVFKRASGNHVEKRACF